MVKKTKTRYVSPARAYRSMLRKRGTLSEQAARIPPKARKGTRWTVQLTDEALRDVMVLREDFRNGRLPPHVIPTILARLVKQTYKVEVTNDCLVRWFGSRNNGNQENEPIGQSEADCGTD